MVAYYLYIEWSGIIIGMVIYLILIKALPVDNKKLEVDQLIKEAIESEAA
ncbi:MAG: hypothetical protein GX078_09000 [Clostridiales bacterium]|nr:hypothetical protein [Clostridiales bacterium]